MEVINNRFEEAGVGGGGGGSSLGSGQRISISRLCSFIGLWMVGSIMIVGVTFVTKFDHKTICWVSVTGGLVLALCYRGSFEFRKLAFVVAAQLVSKLGLTLVWFCVTWILMIQPDWNAYWIVSEMLKSEDLCKSSYDYAIARIQITIGKSIPVILISVFIVHCFLVALSVPKNRTLLRNQRITGTMIVAHRYRCCGMLVEAGSKPRWLLKITMVIATACVKLGHYNAVVSLDSRTREIGCPEVADPVEILTWGEFGVFTIVTMIWACLLMSYERILGIMHMKFFDDTREQYEVYVVRGYTPSAPVRYSASLNEPPEYDAPPSYSEVA